MSYRNVFVVTSFLCLSCGGNDPDSESRSKSLPATLSVPASACDDHQAQKFGDAAFGVQAENASVLAGTATSIEDEDAYAGSAMVLGQNAHLSVPVSFREEGTYAFYVRGRGPDGAHNSVYATVEYGSSFTPSDSDPLAKVLHFPTELAWRKASEFSIGSGDLHRKGSVELREREPDTVIDAVSLVKVGQSDKDSPFVIEQSVGGGILAIPAESVDHFRMAPNDAPFEVVDDGGPEQGWEKLVAPDHSYSAGPGPIAVYRLRFQQAGDYDLWVKLRGFSGGQNSIWVPTDLDANPTAIKEVPEESWGTFTWRKSTEVDVPVEKIGQLVELRIGNRERNTELDSIALVPTALSPAIEASEHFEQLDQAFGVFEAEAGDTNRSTGTSPGASAGIRVRALDTVGQFITFGDAPEGRVYFRYSLEHDSPKQLSVYVNDVDVGTVYFLSTTSWNTFDTTFAYVPAGVARLQLDLDDWIANGKTSAASLDRLSLGEDGRSCITCGEAEVEAALTNASPGDSIVIPKNAAACPGAAPDWRSTLVMNLTNDGSRNRPITLRAEEAGQVRFTGDSKVEVNGDYNVVDGLGYFGPFSGEKEATVFVAEDARHARVTNMSFIGHSPTNPWFPGCPNTGNWVKVLGSQFRVDHNYFGNKRYRGKTVQLRNEGNQKHGIVDHNHFQGRPWGLSVCPQSTKHDECPAKSGKCNNGFEELGLGVNYNHANDHTDLLAAYNLFEECDGEGELVSNKTSGARLLFNTTLGSSGSFTLRHGNDAWVEGNVFVGNRYKGVNIYGSGHVVVNNYFQGIRGDHPCASEGGRSYCPGGETAVAKEPSGGIRMRGGFDDGVTNPTEECHRQATDTIIAHNTVVDSASAVFLYPRPPRDPQNCPVQTWFPPTSVDIVNNIAADSTDTGFVVDVSDPKLDPTFGIEDVNLSGLLFSTNYHSNESDDFWLQYSPLETEPDNWGIHRFSGTLPGAETLSLALEGDLDGEARTGSQAVGADAPPSTQSRPKAPLLSSEVGPRWGARFHLIDASRVGDPADCTEACQTADSEQKAECCFCDGQFGYFWGPDNDQQSCITSPPY